MSWRPEYIGTSIDANLMELREYIEETSGLTNDGTAICGVNLYIGKPDYYGMLVLYAISPDLEDRECCRDMDEIEIVDILEDEELVVFRSCVDPCAAPFTMSFNEADKLNIEQES